MGNNDNSRIKRNVFGFVGSPFYIMENKDKFEKLDDTMEGRIRRHLEAMRRHFVWHRDGIERELKRYEEEKKKNT